MKFKAIVEVTPRESGKSNTDFYEQCKLLYSQQTTFGNFEPFRKCFEYLQTKPKFESWRGHLDNAANNVRKERPIGSKRAKETEAVKEVARKIIVEQKGSNGTLRNTNGGALQGDDMRMMVNNFNAFVEMKMMREMGSGLTNEEIADLDTPDRKAYRKAKASFMIAQMNETVAKRRRLSFTGETSSSVSSAATSVPSVIKPIDGSSNNTNSNELDLEDSVEFGDPNRFNKHYKSTSRTISVLQHVVSTVFVATTTRMLQHPATIGACNTKWLFYNVP